jgi:hypothetical protein
VGVSLTDLSVPDRAAEQTTDRPLRRLGESAGPEGAELRSNLWAHDVLLARVPDLSMTPLGMRAALDARRGRLRRCHEREAHVQHRSDRRGAFLVGTLGRPRDLHWRTPYTPGRVPELRGCGVANSTRQVAAADRSVMRTYLMC